VNYETDKVNILDIQVDVIDRKGLLQEIDFLVQANQPARINTVNVHTCNLAYDDFNYRSVLNSSNILYCDGYGVKLGARFLGKRLGERLTTPDWIDALFDLCELNGYSTYFLGDEPDVVELFAEKVSANHPRILIAGYHDGFFDTAGNQNYELLKEMNNLKPDVILVGMGQPLQELWGWDAMDTLSKGVIVVVGALFRWYTGYERRAPHWITQTGFEWLARLAVSPRKHFRRYVLGLPLFFWRVTMQRLKNSLE
jgi:N-acetylglucosaminyldiphosphoundecaprenol N-acetyl-beta-D-mannosaminyltransferase